jgi:hypothetical protein
LFENSGNDIAIVTPSKKVKNMNCHNDLQPEQANHLKTQVAEKYNGITEVEPIINLDRTQISLVNTKLVTPNYNPYYKPSSYNKNDLSNLKLPAAYSPCNNTGKYDFSKLGLNIKPFKFEDNKVKGEKAARISGQVAFLKCAIIENENDQHVIWWIMETHQRSYLSKFHWQRAIEEQELWTKSIVIDHPQKKLFWHHEGQKMFGFNDKYPIQLFPYTNIKPPGQSKEQIISTAECIAQCINNRTNNETKLIVEPDKLFYYKNNVVWAEIIDVYNCNWKLKQETGDDYSNPNFWDDHKDIIRKYYLPGTLSLELVNRFNAPFEELHPSFRTSEVLMQIHRRRHTNYRENYHNNNNLIRSDISNVDITNDNEYINEFLDNNDNINT